VIALKELLEVNFAITTKRYNQDFLSTKYHDNMTKSNTQIWFTSRNTYEEDDDSSGWNKYIKWSKLSQLEELVSLDGLLNELAFEANLDTEIDEVVIENNQITDFFKSIKYVKRKSNHLDYFNLLAVIKEPKKSKQIQLERDFDFVGYDLIETGGSISALTNCGGFNETFKPEEQNKYGLISDYNRARAIQIELPKNNPNENHADCDLFEVWRHKFIGRNGSFNEAFCVHLEYHLGSTFEKSKQKELKGFWCDGVLHKKLSKKIINDKRLIETTAWIGKDGQGEYRMKIYLGKKSLGRFAKGTPMIDCIPSDETMDWIDLNINKKTIEIELK
jgi:hypothetical protein